MQTPYKIFVIHYTPSKLQLVLLVERPIRVWEQAASTDNSQYLVCFLNDLRSSCCFSRENFERCQTNHPQTGSVILSDIGGSGAVCEFTFSFALGEIPERWSESGSTPGHPSNLRGRQSSLEMRALCFKILSTK